MCEYGCSAHEQGVGQRSLVPPSLNTTLVVVVEGLSEEDKM